MWVGGPILLFALYVFLFLGPTALMRHAVVFWFWKMNLSREPGDVKDDPFLEDEPFEGTGGRQR